MSGVGSHVHAVVYGVLASSGLILGAGVGVLRQPPEQLVAAAFGFASGALTGALAFELFADIDRRGHVATVATAFILGAALFVLTDVLLGRRTSGGSAVGFALLAAVTLDGVPENVALGVTLSGAGGGSVVLLVAVFVSNFPEALASAATLREDGRSRLFIVTIWLAAALLLTAAVVVGQAIVPLLAPGGRPVALAFAGGAVLASLADTLMPEAYRRGGAPVAFATALGFLISYLVATA